MVPPVSQIQYNPAKDELTVLPIPSALHTWLRPRSVLKRLESSWSAFEGPHSALFMSMGSAMVVADEDRMRTRGGEVEGLRDPPGRGLP